MSRRRTRINASAASSTTAANGNCSTAWKRGWAGHVPPISVASPGSRMTTTRITVRYAGTDPAWSRAVTPVASRSVPPIATS